MNFFKGYFPNKFSKKFNLGRPEILKINFVSNLNNKSKVKGSEEIKWIIKYSGFSLRSKFLSGKKEAK